MWTLLLCLAHAGTEPAEPESSPQIEVTLLADKKGSEVVSFDRLRDIRRAEPLCDAPCTFSLQPGRHGVATRGGWMGSANTRLRVKEGDAPVVLRARKRRIWAMVGFGVMETAALFAIASSAATVDVCYLYEPGGALANPSQAASCRAKAARSRSSGLATAGVFQVGAVPFLLLSMPRMQRIRGAKAQRLRAELD